MPEKQAVQQSATADRSGGRQDAPAAQLQSEAGAQRALGNRGFEEAVQSSREPLIVDEGAQPSAGQMRKTEFMASLRAAVCTAADEGLAAAGRTSAGCPWIEFWIRHYSAKPASEVNNAVRKFAPETASARSAAEAIPIITGQVRRSVDHWVRTGELTGMPEDEAGALSGGGVLGALLFKSRAAGASSKNAAVVRHRLGRGRPMESGSRNRMERVFGLDFSHVRLHTEDEGPALANGMNALAFTVGEHLAFAPGEYRPGHPIGDALLAHELAHVAQQDAAATSSVPATESLERDADTTAGRAVAGLWGGDSRGAAPSLKSGLSLQRCGGEARQTRPKAPQAMNCTAPPTREQWAAGVNHAKAPGNEQPDEMVQLAQQAVCAAGIRVHVAGKVHTDQTHSADYEPYAAGSPVVNFDVLLNKKKRWPGAYKDDAPPVGDDAGYHFSDGDRDFAIIGPNALDAASPLITLMYAQHEMYHITHQHGGKGKQADEEELETWTNDFRNYFHQYLTIPYPERPAWQPLLKYYDRSRGPARKAAIDRLMDYFEHPPGDAAKIQRAIRAWLHRQGGSSQLATDWNARLPPKEK